MFDLQGVAEVFAAWIRLDRLKSGFLSWFLCTVSSQKIAGHCCTMVFPCSKSLAGYPCSHPAPFYPKDKPPHSPITWRSRNTPVHKPLLGIYSLSCSYSIIIQYSTTKSLSTDFLLAIFYDIPLSLLSLLFLLLLLWLLLLLLHILPCLLLLPLLLLLYHFNMAIILLLLLLLLLLVFYYHHYFITIILIIGFTTLITFHTQPHSAWLTMRFWRSLWRRKWLARCRFPLRCASWGRIPPASWNMLGIYPLVIQHSYWKSQFLNGKYTINGHFQ